MSNGEEQEEMEDESSEVEFLADSRKHLGIKVGLEDGSEVDYENKIAEIIKKEDGTYRFREIDFADGEDLAGIPCLELHTYVAVPTHDWEGLRIMRITPSVESFAWNEERRAWTFDNAVTPVAFYKPGSWKYVNTY